jgi:ribosomal protein L11 methyltransferase
VPSAYDDLPNTTFAMPGPLRERLSGLVMAGVKTGTFGLQVFDEIEPEEVLSPGTLSVLRASNNQPLAIVEQVSQQYLRLGDVTWEQVDSEGESFRSIADWRHGHEVFWAQFLEEIRTHTNDPHWEINDDTIVSYETLRVVETLPHAHDGRYPVVELIVPLAEAELASSDLYDLETIGIEELPISALITPDRAGETLAPPDRFVCLRAGFASVGAAVHAESELSRNWHPRFEVIVGDDWLDSWREHFDPVRAGRIVIVPAWRLNDPAVTNHPEYLSAQSNTNDIVLSLDPQRSWGTGGHQSTRLALLSLQKLNVQNASILDVGCGSGVLAIAALLLGAAQALGTDIESGSVSVTHDNAERNGVRSRCEAITTPIADITHTYDVVLANILAPVLIDLALHLKARTGNLGTLILAGLINDQEQRVVTAFHPMVVTDRIVEGNWVSLTLQHQK